MSLYNLVNGYIQMRQRFRRIDDITMGQYRNELYQAVHALLFPRIEISRSERVNVSLISNDPNVEAALLKWFASRRTRSLSEAVLNFARETATRCFVDGHVFYQFVYDRAALRMPPRENEENLYLNTELRWLHPDMNIHGFNCCVGVRTNVSAIGGRKLYFVKPNDLIKFNAPTKYPTLKTLDTFLYRVEKASLLELDMYSKFDEKTKQLNIDSLIVNNNRRNLKLAMSYITSSLGFNFRETNTEMTGFYCILRYLQFRRYLIILREEMFDGINKMLAQTGKQLGFTASIKVDGLISLQEVDQVIAEVLDGRLSLTEAVKVVQQRSG